jgi:predicted glycogen debranching enzyme
MGYIKFDKTQLINLEYSLEKEIIRSNRAGTYSFTSLIGANTRRYHGLLACPIENLRGTHLLLSSLDETIIQHGSSFNLALHKYPGGVYEPRGHKYIRDFDTEPNISIIYRVGGVILKKEMVLITGKEQILIRYTLIDAHSPTTLQFRPFLAFRDINSLCKSNADVNSKYSKIKNGIKIKLYNGYPFLHMQFSKEPEFNHAPNWFYNIEYIRDQRRGYDYQEDLFVPGYFELPIKKGETIVFSASTFEAIPDTLKKQVDSELKGRIQRGNLENCLTNSAQQFIVTIRNKKSIKAGLPWYETRSRDTFIALPGLTLPGKDYDSFHEICANMIASMQGSLFTDSLYGMKTCTSADAPLWFLWSLQKYCEQTCQYADIWKRYGKTIKKIFSGYKQGIPDMNISLHENGLLWQGNKNTAYTWMNAIVDGNPVTPRYGYSVEINALWYNALKFSLDLAKISGDDTFIIIWGSLPPVVAASFVSTFIHEKHGYLVDCVCDEGTCHHLRPNQIFAASLFYSPVDDENIRKKIVDRVERELLTSKGLRSLTPNDDDYKGTYFGDEKTRDNAMHQGSVFPWLMAHFCEAYLKIYGKAGLSFINRIYSGFEEDMIEHGIGTISEIYDGDPPHKPGGAPSMAVSVAEIIRLKQIIDEYQD